MSIGLISALEELCNFLSGFDPDCYTGAECAAIAAELEDVEKAISAIRVLAEAALREELVVTPPE